uniref:lysozyme n=1 Tax=Clastoptera arizonana TaxID=38151 RepID=A0A1B6C4E1_9HEMI
MAFKSVLVCVCAATIASALIYRHPARQQQILTGFTENCLGCICDATTACNLTIGCYAGLCGPFLIGRQYWIDAGAPVLPGATWQSPQAYETCVNDPSCATSTIFNYMSRYVNDCNSDGTLDCDDYARIHYLGGNQCDIPIHNYAYYRLFRQCWSKNSKLD